MTRVSGSPNQPLYADPTASPTAPSPLDPNARASGSGSFGPAGGPMPSPQPSYGAPSSAPPLTEADLALLNKALEASGTSVGGSSFDYDSVISALGSLMIEHIGNQRSQAMQQRSLGYQEAKGALMQQAAEMKDAANKMDKGATISMAIGITTAGISMIGSGASFAKQASSFRRTANAMEEMRPAQKALNEATESGEAFTKIGAKIPSQVQNKIENAQANFKVAANKAAEIDREIQLFQTGAEITGRVGDMGKQLGGGLDAREQANAKRDESEGAIAAAEATSQQQKAEMGKEVQQALDDMIKQIINFVKEIKENEVEMMRAITR